MFRDRLAVSILLIPVALWVVDMGGMLYTLCLMGIFALAGREYVHLFRRGGLRPALPVVTGGVAALILLLTLLAVTALGWHVVDYERGAPASGTDFAVTLGGVVYLGLMSSYLIALRQLPDGKWWVLMVLPGVWMVDSGAYTIGSNFGRHKMAPRLSPRKTWEGFAGGVVWGVFFTALFSAVWQAGAGPASQVTALNGALMGGVLGLVTPLGDVGISMLKRQFSLKDSGALLAGHGGALDRTDSWMVAALVGYWMAVWLTR
ncbi:MAG: phosphatidate cytidylyltransferase [Chloroflexi bacterium]|nr:phosphatidate cytidylyltransferase [Chloroflexota bacterium]